MCFEGLIHFWRFVAFAVSLSDCNYILHLEFQQKYCLVVINISLERQMEMKRRGEHATSTAAWHHFETVSVGFPCAEHTEKWVTFLLNRGVFLYFFSTLCKYMYVSIPSNVSFMCPLVHEVNQWFSNCSVSWFTCLGIPPANSPQQMSKSPWAASLFEKRVFERNITPKQTNQENIRVFPRNRVPPQSSILIGFSIIFTIHFGVPIYVHSEILDVMLFTQVTGDPKEVEQCPEALKISNFAGYFLSEGPGGYIDVWMEGWMSWVELSWLLSLGVDERKSWIIQECD